MPGKGNKNTPKTAKEGGSNSASAASSSSKSSKASAAPDTPAPAAPDRRAAAEHAKEPVVEAEAVAQEDAGSFHECSEDQSVDAAEPVAPRPEVTVSGAQAAPAATLPAMSPVYHPAFIHLLPNVLLGAAGMYRAFVLLLSSIYFLFVDRDEEGNLHLPREALGVQVLRTNPTATDHPAPLGLDAVLTSLNKITDVPAALFNGLPLGITTSNVAPIHLEYLMATFNTLIDKVTKQPATYKAAQLLKCSPDIAIAGAASSVSMFDCGDIYSSNPFADIRYYRHTTFNIPVILPHGPWFRNLSNDFDPFLWEEMRKFHTAQLSTSGPFFSRETTLNLRIYSELQRIFHLFMLAFATR